MKSNEVGIRTALDIKTAAGIVNNVFRQHKAFVESIEMSSNPLDALDGEPDIAVVGKRAGKMNMWAVEVYFFRDDPGTLIGFAAMGHGGFTRAVGGTRNTISLTKSTEQMHNIVNAIRSADPTAEAFDPDEEPINTIPVAGSSEGPAVSAGWYADPAGVDSDQRYWDGAAWTEHRAPGLAG